jgi:hypothetical protein
MEPTPPSSTGASGWSALRAAAATVDMVVTGTNGFRTGTGRILARIAFFLARAHTGRDPAEVVIGAPKGLLARARGYRREIYPLAGS